MLQNIVQAIKEDAQIKEEQNSRKRSIQKMMERVHWLEQQILDIREHHVQASQVVLQLYKT
jgi:predicted Holliday junction resolvase-like endonuclease